MLVWDNQLATNWFVGILEGEGTFHRRKNGRKHIHIYNTDIDIIKGCESVLNSFGILVNTYPIKRRGKNKQQWQIDFPELEIRMLYWKVLPYMECRLDEYQQLMGASETTRSPSVNLGWLIGIFEAEGSFSLSYEYKRPMVDIVNTNIRIIEKIALNLKALNLAYYIKDYVPDKNAPYTRMYIHGMLRCKRFLEATENLWRSERNLKRSNLLLEFIRSRLSNPCEQHSPYSSRELQIYHSLKELNR